MSLFALWVASGESPEWIARHTEALLNRLQADLAFDVWKTPKGRQWDDSLDASVEFVKDHVAIGMLGDPEPESGYLFTLSGEASRVALDVQVSAGATSLGRRIPLHSLTIDLRELVVGGVTSAVVDTVCSAVAEAWDPAVLTLSDSPVNRIARRGNWKIGVGYRLWISTEVGAVVGLADGLASAPLAEGTLVSAPDDWPADHVVTAMLETLTANGLDEIPH